MSNWVDTAGVDQAHPSLSPCARQKGAPSLGAGQRAQRQDDCHFFLKCATVIPGAKIIC